ncbi:hypothetical protein OG777_12765 [Micromonospora peucetia]|uniref:hypothetical protein n=1 Tax=Micromonospora peucetia TaxID=47871 RepID=UPI00225709C4|nr:hypothetical protein [Micromonospora peucetia]MCX4387799.1 hypothetical protein [Micromonospora peucetia]
MDSVVNVDHRLGCLGVGQTRMAVAQRLPRCGQEPVRIHHDDIASFRMLIVMPAFGATAPAMPAG